MPGRIAKFLGGRAARKFRRNRLAVAALAVISVYAFIGLWLTVADAAARFGGGGIQERGFEGGEFLFTALTLDKVDSRVGPLGLRGFAARESAETRARHIKYHIDRFEKALRLKDPEHRRAAIDLIRLGERRVGITADEAARIIPEIEAGYRALDVYDDLDAAPESWPALDELERRVDSLYAPLSGWRKLVYDFRLSLGTDRQGRSIAARAVYSIKVALQIGFIVALVSVAIGSLLGAAAAYFGSWVDGFVTWLFSTLSSVPDLVLLAVLAYMFTGSTFDDPSRPFLSLVPVYAAMCMTFWIGPCRVVRGEVLKLKELEYVQAATAIGYPRSRILLRHVLPNTLHLMFINFSLLFIAAIKFEVVLSFLNLGVKSGPSWGRMIQESTQEVINGNFWQIGAATAFMFVLVLAFNILSDALQDAFDPRHVG